MGYGSYTELALYGELPTRQESGPSRLERWSMGASSFTRRLLAHAAARDWAWWKLPWLLRCYVTVVPVAAVVLAVLAAVRTTWHADDAWKFALLLGCGLISVAATPRVV